MCAASCAAARPGSPLTPALRSAIVKLTVTRQQEDYALPWQSGRPVTGTGSGFIIEGQRILSNAHVVSDARFMQVQKEDDPRRYRARLEFAGHDCDLAVLRVDDPGFFEGTCPVTFAPALPELSDEVTVLGYPLGGSRLSVTRGVVSRIDYSVYSHSGVDQHLVLQVDAAINPGNSGGPVLFGGEVVGLAFQGLAWGENIGYAIPVPVIRHFLVDIDDGVYHGYPELGVAHMPLRNAALRTDLGLPDTETGVVLYYVDPFGSARGYLRERDVLLSINRVPIADDGTVVVGANTVEYAELIERKQWGQPVEFTVWRDGARVAVTVPLTNPRDPFVFRFLYDRRPEYYILGGLVFSPLTREYLQTLRGDFSTPNRQQLLYCTQYAKRDGLYREHDQFVVLIRRLPHPVNTYADSFAQGIVTHVNDRPVRDLHEFAAAVENGTEPFLSLRFLGMPETLVLKTDETKAADAAILASYGIAAKQHLEPPLDAAAEPGAAP